MKLDDSGDENWRDADWKPCGCLVVIAAAIVILAGYGLFALASRLMGGG